MPSKKRYHGFRHILENGQIKKVEWEKKTGKYFFVGTDNEVPAGKVVPKSRMYEGKILPMGTKKRHLSYGTWWSQCNMDGSFAYNGVTDDF
jgi:hypothetical protein